MLYKVWIFVLCMQFLCIFNSWFWLKYFYIFQFWAGSLNRDAGADATADSTVKSFSGITESLNQFPESTQKKEKSYKLKWIIFSYIHFCNKIWKLIIKISNRIT